MRIARAAARFLFAFSLLFPIVSGAQAPGVALTAAPAAYEVKRGDTLFSIARRLRTPELTLNQVLVALYRANPDAFHGGNINQLRLGAVLAVPPRETMATTDAAAATQEVSALIAAKPSAPAPVAEPKPAPAPPSQAAPAPREAPKAALGRDEAERRFREAVALEKRGDAKGAFRAYLEAGEGGHGLAQKRLGELYDKGTPAVPRDYETALRWYQKARDQGVAVPRPETRGPAIR